MQARGVCFFVLVLGCWTAQAADNTSLKKVVKGKVEELNKALLKEEFGKVVDLTYPKVVKMMGGREKMISVMRAGFKDRKARGFTLRSFKVDTPSELVAAGPDLFVVVPFLLEIKAPGGRILQKGFVIGVSSNRGKSWTFVTADQDVKQLKKILPNLPEQLKLPKREKPVFEKE